MNVHLERISEIAAVLDGMPPGEIQRAMDEIRSEAIAAQDHLDWWRRRPTGTAVVCSRETCTI